jgi:hypothetical protein
MQAAMGEVCLDADKRGAFGVSRPSAAGFDHLLLAAKAFPVAQAGQKPDPGPETVGNRANVG